MNWKGKWRSIWSCPAVELRTKEDTEAKAKSEYIREHLVNYVEASYRGFAPERKSSGRLVQATQQRRPGFGLSASPFFLRRLLVA